MSGNMEDRKLESLIRDYLKESKLMHLATSVNNQPWLCHVWFSYDKNLNIYFISKPYRRHVKELLKQPKVAGGMVNIKLVGLGQKVRGLSFQGKAEEVKGAGLLKAYSCYVGRWPKAKKNLNIKAIISRGVGSRIYRIRPKTFVLFDEVNYPEEPRQEFKVK